ncbi:basic salivary proline-rich protein 4-like [Felis catus]|uniref:basic salivary proline-rich protein 4-like n=1 Tax=Felis catus TaxID=9685 RepID=UPI001D19FF15|nr:basic salivary proline-rich protein 4-like [Felis catus]
MSTHQYQSLGDHVSPTFGTVDTTQGFKAQASARAEPLQSSGLLPRGGRQPSQSGPPPNIYPRGLGHWPSGLSRRLSPVCRAEAWAALGTRGLVQERLIHPHTTRFPLPSPIPATRPPGHPALASRRPQGHELGRRRLGGGDTRGLAEGLTVLGAGDDTGSQRQGRRVLPAARGGEEGGESAGPAPPPSSTHDGGSGCSSSGGGGGGGTGGPGAGRHLRADRAPRPAPRSCPPGPLARRAGRREQGGRSREAPEQAGGGAGAGARLTVSPTHPALPLRWPRERASSAFSARGAPGTRVSASLPERARRCRTRSFVGLQPHISPAGPRSALGQTARPETGLTRSGEQPCQTCGPPGC